MAGLKLTDMDAKEFMMKYKRIFTIVLDSLGVGAMPALQYDIIVTITYRDCVDICEGYYGRKAF